MTRNELLGELIKVLPYIGVPHDSLTTEQAAAADAFARNAVDYLRENPAEEPGPMEMIFAYAPELPHRHLPGRDFPEFCHICGGRATDSPHHGATPPS